MDEQLVRLLGQDARQSSETLAKRLNLSPPTIRRRLKKLISNGLLQIVGVIDPTKFGLALAAVIAINVTHYKLDAALETLANWPEIRWVSTTTGRFDIITVARFASTEALSEFLAKKLASLEGMRDSETFVCLDMKKGHYIAIC